MSGPLEGVKILCEIDRTGYEVKRGTDSFKVVRGFKNS